MNKAGKDTRVGCGPPGYKLRVSQSYVPTAWGAFDQPGGTATVVKTVTEHNSVGTAAGNASNQRTFELSAGAKAGIGIGTSAVGVACLVLVGYLALRRKQVRTLNKAPKFPQEEDQAYRSGGAALSELHPFATQELAGRNRVEPTELHPDPATQELAGVNRAELEASRLHLAKKET